MKLPKGILLCSLLAVGCGQSDPDADKTSLSAVDSQFVTSSVAPYLGTYVGETSGLFSSDGCRVAMGDAGTVSVKTYDDDGDVKKELRYWGLSEKRLTDQSEDKLEFENSDGTTLLGYEKMKLVLELKDGVLDSVKVSLRVIGLSSTWESITCKDLKPEA